MPTVYWYRIATARPACAEYWTGMQERIITRPLRQGAGKGAYMPTEDDLERRLWRTMPWDAEIMVPSDEQDEKDEKEGDGD